ncbi:hypothetical protein A4A49_64145, partial [Nicotiana attenuata]
MAELCGYERDSVTFWHKCGRYGNRMRLVSTDVEATVISKNIPDHKVVEVYFEHLDSYIGKTIHTNEVSGAEQEKEVHSEHSSTNDEFEDSENDFSDDNENVNHIYEVSEEVKKKMAAEEGDTDCVDSDDTKSLECDSDSESFNFSMFNPKTDGIN